MIQKAGTVERKTEFPAKDGHDAFFKFLIRDDCFFKPGPLRFNLTVYDNPATRYMYEQSKLIEVGEKINFVAEEKQVKAYMVGKDKYQEIELQELYKIQTF